MTHCPTEAIRVRGGRAHIIRERCIDCGVCVRVCPNKAKKAECDPFERLKDFAYTVALPAPTLYGQFRNLDSVNRVLTGLLEIGFHAVYEVAKAAESISAATRQALLDPNRPKPVISSACPACVRLICVRFPDLIPHVIDMIAPFELAAIRAREEAAARSGLKPEEIGVFFITPCPAKVTAAKYPMLLNAPVVDGCLSMADIYKRLLPAMKKIKTPLPLRRTGSVGIGWARSGGEAAALVQDGKLYVDGIRNVARVLESVEDGSLSDISFIELNACNLGCVDGCLTVENAYIAREHLEKLTRSTPVSLSRIHAEESRGAVEKPQKQLEYQPTFELEGDALAKYARMEELAKLFPGMDCGSCGAPSCRALAEDIVQGYASENDCIFRMREKLQALSGVDSDEFLPPPFRKSPPEAGKEPQDP